LDADNTVAIKEARRERGGGKGEHVYGSTLSSGNTVLENEKPLPVIDTISSLAHAV